MFAGEPKSKKEKNTEGKKSAKGKSSTAILKDSCVCVCL